MEDLLIIATIAGPVVGVIVGIALDRAIERRPRVIAYYGHASSFRVIVPSGHIWVFTHSVVVRNSGRRAAENVRLGHAVFPDNFNVQPDMPHEVVELPGGSKEIVIPKLLPGEQATISYLYEPPVTVNQINTSVKSDEGLARVVTVLPQEQYPRWMYRVAGLLMLMGAAAAFYGAYLGLRLLIGSPG